MAAPRLYGAGPYGTSTYGSRKIDIGGVAAIGFATQGEMIRTWQQPSHVCESGTWTLTTLPGGPPNEMELVI